jgi:hypothetical protein
MKKAFISSVFCLAALVLFYTGCSFGPDPQKVLSQYLDDFYHGNYEKAYALLSSKDKTVRSLQEFSGDKAEFNAMRKAMSNKITFKVKDVKVTGDKALATVDVTMPDLTAAMDDLMAAAFSQAFGGGKPDEKAMEKKITEKMNDKNLPTTTTTEQFDLLKEKDGWRIYMGWENEKKIEQLKAEAEKLDKQKKFIEARAKYSEILSLSSRNKEAPKKIKALDEKIVKYKEKQAYFPNIEIRDVNIGKSVLGIVGVFGEIKNKGDKSLKRVEITTYCLDKDGKVVFEKTFLPVLVSEYSFGFRGNKPLKPNYSEKFGYKLDDAPSDWNGNVRVEVTDIEFD